MLILLPIFFLLVSAAWGDRALRPLPYLRHWREMFYKDYWTIRTTEKHTASAVSVLVLACLS
jgi:hypothetical protein